MSVRAHELLGSISAPHELTLGLEVGERIDAPAPFPSVEVLSVDIAPVTQLVYQTLRLSARLADDADAPSEEVVLGRLVAVLDSGAEIEITRDALPSDADDPAVDTTRCHGCGGAIPAGAEFHIHDGAAYHDRCWEA